MRSSRVPKADTAAARCLVKEIRASAKSHCFYSALFPWSIYLSVKYKMNDLHFKILLFPKHLLKKYINLHLQKNCNLIKEKENLMFRRTKHSCQFGSPFSIPVVYNQDTWGLCVVRTGSSLQTNWPYAKNDHTKWTIKARQQQQWEVWKHHLKQCI